jgi:hypothetical protein
MQPRLLGGLMILTLGLGLLFGCRGSDEVETVDVSGKVTLDEKPLAGATIFFITDKHTGTGKTGPDGSYKLENGAVPGLNQVYLSKIKGGAAGAGDDPAAVAGETDPGKIAAGQAIPAKYADPLNPQLQYTVPEEGSTSANFDLKSP